METIKTWAPEQDIIPLHEPLFIGNEKKYVLDCIESGWVSSVGKYVDEFERNLAEFTGVKRAVAVVNGTAALHIALKLAGVKTDDEVMIPSLTFVATANAVIYENANPHFVDVDQRTLGIDPKKLREYLTNITQIKDGKCVNKRTGRVISAIVPMHTFGHPVSIDELKKVTDEFYIAIVEDAAESLGSYYKGIHTGNFGKVAAVSFNGNKTITTGGGGAILTNDDEVANRAKHLTTTAKVPHRWEYTHDEIGYNYRMPNINAALGVAQLEQLPSYLKQKRQLAEKYKLLFSCMDGVKFYEEPEYGQSNYWLQTIILDPNVHDRNQVLELLNKHGIMSRPIWMPLHELIPFQSCPQMNLSATEQLKNSVINIPSSPYLGEL
ncbi:LegC family aminotransferase [Metabacillus sp. FJAT-52054]|uniref:LegC family aminotransferase n=1 Tax=Metabacillus sediminis TaxID=3117746 RepID=A0ABZ2NH71_9BACI